MLGLALLDAAVSSTAAAQRAGGLLSGISTCIARVLDPTVPAIPDRRQHGGAAPQQQSSAAAQQTAGPDLGSPDWTTSPTPPSYV
jgi:hypothetical protein